MNYKMIAPSQVDALLNSRDVQVIDLRDPEDYRKYHLKNAISIPYELLDDYKYSLSKNKQLFLYCDHGSISLRAAKHLADEGYRTVTLIGGIYALQNKNLE